MQLALLSDIHGNATALEAVLSDVRNCGINQLLIAGDFVGYYSRADEVFDLLASWTWEGVQGNHDAVFDAFRTGNGDRAEYRKRYGQAIDRTLRTLSPERSAMLAALPVTRELHMEGRHVLLCHGTPWQQDAYVFPTAPPATFARIAALGYDVVVLGHTHYPMVRQEGSTLIVNPGSVGQPRDVGALASWAVLDCTARAATIRRVRFDPVPVIADAHAHDPELPYLCDVLTRTTSPYAA